MDPNSVLIRLRICMAGLTKAAAEGTLDKEDVSEAVEAWESLDHWMSQNGFRPAYWRRHGGPKCARCRQIIKRGQELERVVLAGQCDTTYCHVGCCYPREKARRLLRKPKTQ